MPGRWELWEGPKTPMGMKKGMRSRAARHSPASARQQPRSPTGRRQGWSSPPLPARLIHSFILLKHQLPCRVCSFGLTPAVEKPWSLAGIRWLVLNTFTGAGQLKEQNQRAKQTSHCQIPVQRLSRCTHPLLPHLHCPEGCLTARNGRPPYHPNRESVVLRMRVLYGVSNTDPFCFHISSKSVRKEGASNRRRSPVDHVDMESFLKFLLKEVVNLQKTGFLVCIVAGSRCNLQRLSGKSVHGNFIHGNGACYLHANWRNVSRWRGLCRSRTGSGPPPPVPITWHPGIRRTGRSLKEFPLGLKPQLFVLLNINVHSQNTYGFGHNKRQGSKIKRPTIVVMVLFVLISLVTWVTCIA